MRNTDTLVTGRRLPHACPARNRSARENIKRAGDSYSFAACMASFFAESCAQQRKPVSDDDRRSSTLQQPSCALAEPFCTHSLCSYTHRAFLRRVELGLALLPLLVTVVCSPASIESQQGGRRGPRVVEVLRELHRFEQRKNAVPLFASTSHRHVRPVSAAGAHWRHHCLHVCADVRAAKNAVPGAREVTHAGLASFHRLLQGCLQQPKRHIDVHRRRAFA